MYPRASKSWGCFAGNNRTPIYCDCDVISPDSVIATAEDGLLVRRGTRCSPLTQLMYSLEYSGEMPARQRSASVLSRPISRVSAAPRPAVVAPT